MSSYGPILEEVEHLLRHIPLDEFRSDLMLAEKLAGSGDTLPDMPSGRSFQSHTKKARLWMDFLDEWTALETSQ